MESATHRTGVSLVNGLGPRRDAVTAPTTKHPQAGQVFHLNTQNSERKALRDPGLSVLTANPSESGLKGVNSPGL